MRVVKPITEQDGLIVSVNVPEPDPSVGEVEYNPATNYALGAKAISSTTHRQYESVQAGNTGHDLTDTAWWLYVGPTNAYRMFDLLRNTQTTMAAGPLVATVIPQQRFDSFAVVGVMATMVDVTVRNSNMDIIYFERVYPSERSVQTWFEYFYGTFEYDPNIAVFNLPVSSDHVLQIAASSGADNQGPVAIGGVVVGVSTYLGKTEQSAVSDVTNFSVIERDEFGNATLVPRRSIPKNDMQTIIEKDCVNVARTARTDLNAVPALWSWLDDQDDEYFESGVVLGIYRRFTITLDQPDHATISLELEEI